MGFKAGLELEGATKEKKELFFSGLVFLMQGNGQRRKQCYQIAVRGERTNTCCAYRGIFLSHLPGSMNLLLG